jgi:release factor glutamine methyltransferase
MTKAEEWLLKDKYQGEKSEAFFADCERLKTGEPLAYVIGFIPFLDCKIWLDSKPLIPRSETEFWTAQFIASLVKNNQSTNINDLKVLDLCAGSGCIGTAVAKKVSMVGVDFGEIDAHHLPTIAKNLSENNIDVTNIHIILSDLFSNITERYDYILTNPPYIDPAIDRTEASVRQFEPPRALYGGHHGLELIKTIITTAPAYLKQHGQIWLEHEPEQASAISNLAITNGFSAVTHTDQYHIPRWSILVLQ